MSIWEKLGFGGYRGFSREAEQLLQQAVELAGSFGCSQADTGHLLLAMLQQEQGAAARFLNSRHISEQAVRRQLAENRRGPAQHLDRHAMAPDLRRTMDYALIGAQNAHVSRWRMMAARRGCCWLPWECPSLRPCGSAASCPGSLSFPLSRGCRPACRGRAVPAINIAAT